MAKKKANSKKSTKKSSKKSTKKTTRKKAPRRKKKSSAMVGLVVIVIVAVVAILLWLALRTGPAPEESVPGAMIVSVNGVEITQAQLEFQYNLLPASYKQQLSAEQVLEQIVDEELVVQDARAQGIEVTAEDVNERIQGLLTQGGLSITDLQLNLAQFNISMDEFEALIERQLLLDRYMKEFIDAPEVSEEELRLVYDGSRDRFEVADQVTVRHILISTQRDSAAELARDTLEDIRAGADFCDLVANLTDDVGSRETCGEYTFPRGFMVPEFEKSSFDMAPGDSDMVQTSFGYHVIEKLGDVPGGVQPFEEVRAQLEAEISSAANIQAYKLLTSRLRDTAVIVYAGEDSPEAVEEELVELEEELDDVVEVLEELPEEEPMEESSDLYSCIAGKTTLYGTAWSADSQSPRVEFSENGVELPYVACDDAEDCPTVSAYPTWIIDGETHLGRMSVEELQAAANC